MGRSRAHDTGIDDDETGPSSGSEAKRRFGHASALAQKAASASARPIPEVMTFDGTAAVVRGDTLVTVWTQPARLPRARWIFEIADRLAASSPNGLLALMVLLPTVSPPDAETRRENQVRMQRLGRSVRRWTTVVIGDDLFQMVTRSVLRIMSRFYLSATESHVVSSVDEGVERLLEAASRQSPSARTVSKDLRSMYEILGIASSELFGFEAPSGSYESRPPRPNDVDPTE